MLSQIYNDDEESYESNLTPSRLSGVLGDWCVCGCCKVMPTETECICCNEVDEIKYFRLEGIILSLLLTKFGCSPYLRTDVHVRIRNYEKLFGRLPFIPLSGVEITVGHIYEGG